MFRKIVAAIFVLLLVFASFAGCSKVEVNLNEDTSGESASTASSVSTGKAAESTAAVKDTDDIGDAEDSTDGSAESNDPANEAANDSEVRDEGVLDAENFNTTLFIGDSRTEGIKLYGGVDTADFFSSVGLNIFRLFSETVDVPGYGSTDLGGLLSAKSYKKIFITLGINEMGYNLDVVAEKFGEAVSRIKDAQSGATVYIEANLHIRTSRSDSDAQTGGPFVNSVLNELNSKLAGFANGTDVIYLDPNVLFDDAAGGLDEQYASDDFHLQAFAYKRWMSWLEINT